MPDTSRREGREVILRDSTLREGLDTPGVAFGMDDALVIARELVRAGVREAEVVAPARVVEDLRIVQGLREGERRIRLSGLIYAAGDRLAEEIDLAGDVLDRVDLIMPLSEHRPPADQPTKQRMLLDALARARSRVAEVGVGFPNSTQVERSLVTEIAAASAAAGAARITIYDTNGSADPNQIRDLVSSVLETVNVPVFFHGHNDLGLATANAFAAAVAGVAGLDVTVNGLGDRAGNASLEQLALLLRLRGFQTGIDSSRLVPLSRTVARASGVAVSGLAPVVGEFVFAHRSPGHFGDPTLFEAFDPGVVGSRRRLVSSEERGTTEDQTSDGN